MIHTQNTQQTYTGLEHLQRGQNAFTWRIKQDLGPDEIDPKTVDLSCVDKKERIRFKNLVRFYNEQKHMTAAQATAHVLRKNQFSEIARANPGASDRAAQIRKGGI